MITTGHPDGPWLAGGEHPGGRVVGGGPVVLVVGGSDDGGGDGCAVVVDGCDAGGDGAGATATVEPGPVRWLFEGLTVVVPLDGVEDG
ncbi:MAG: hypothetical protein ACYDH6_24690 [Acidimicrobiales bacterium]